MTRIGPAMPYKMGDDYNPNSPTMKASRFTGRLYITGTPKRLTERDMVRNILAEHPDATDIRMAGHSRAIFHLGQSRIAVLHTTPIIWSDRDAVTFRAHAVDGTENETGWHTPATRNAIMDMFPMVRPGWTARAWGDGHNRTAVSLHLNEGHNQTLTIEGRKPLTIHL
jgi:hypothetical protein